MCHPSYDYAHLIEPVEAELRAESAARQCPCRAHMEHKQCDSYCDCYDLEEWQDDYDPEEDPGSSSYRHGNQ